MNIYKNLSSGDISLQNLADETTHIKDSKKHDIGSLTDLGNEIIRKIKKEPYITKAIANSGESNIAESIILQDLENQGVQFISKVKNNPNGIPMSVSGLVSKGNKGDPYLLTSIGFEKIDGEDWENVEFESEHALVRASINACYILQDIYDKGYLHHDIKPTNLMQGKDGNTYIIDFNSTKKHKDGISKTVSGTPVYQSPERRFPEIFRQFYGGPEALSKTKVTGDIYALAVTIAQTAGIDITPFLLEFPKYIQSTDQEKNRKKYKQYTSAITALIQERLNTFHQSIEDAVVRGEMSGKLGLVLILNTSEDYIKRAQSFSEFAKTLEMVNDAQIADNALFEYISPRHRKKIATTTTKVNPLPMSNE